MIGALRCIWDDGREHAPDAGLELRDGTAADGVLRCRGCGARFPIVRGVPVLLSGDELLEAERVRLDAPTP